MPSVVFDIENSFGTITRLVTKSVIEQLMFITGIEGAEVIINEPLGYGKNPAATSNVDAPALKLESKDYVIVSYTEAYDGQVIDPMTNQEEHLPIYKYGKLGILVKPITSKTNIEFDITYRSKSFNTLATWLSRFERNKIVRVPSNYHNLLYNYTLPEVVVAYIYDVYQLTQLVEPVVGETLSDYFKAHFTEGLMSRSNLNGKQNALAVNVESIGNLGFFSSLPDKITQDKDKVFNEITMSYTLQYDKVTELLLEYQVFIHNQRIDKIYKSYFMREDHPKESHQGRRTFSGLVNTVTEKPEWYKVTKQEIFFDEEDKWLPTLSLSDYSTMLITPIQFDNNDLTLVDDLTLFDNDVIPANVKTIMLYFYQYVTIPYNFPFTLELYAVDDKEKLLNLTMDANGVITTTSTIDLRKRHYLKLSLLTDLRRLPLDILKSLCLLPEWLIYILQLINPNFNPSSIYNPPPYRIDLEKLWNLLNSPPFNKNPNSGIVGNPRNGGYPGGLSFNNSMFGYYVNPTVQTINVIAKRK